MFFIIFILTSIFSFIWPNKNPFTIHFIIFPISNKLSSITPSIYSYFINFKLFEIFFYYSIYIYLYKISLNFFKKNNKLFKIVISLAFSMNIILKKMSIILRTICPMKNTSSAFFSLFIISFIAS